MLKPRRVMLQCRSLVSNKSITRETRDGAEVIVITSFTLPENIVMNGVLYPTEERNNSIELLERILAPIEHPTDADGNFISANDPHAIQNFHVGVYNENARIEGNRIAVDKVVNVQQANKSDKGKRLLDRIVELETNKDARPIHTSVGVYLEVDVHDAPLTNELGQEYNMTAHNLVFDHDAILLDSIGAATPDQGVGIMANSTGDIEQCELHTYSLGGDMKKKPKTQDLRVSNKDSLSFDEIRSQIYDELRAKQFGDDVWLVEVYDDYFIFESYKEDQKIQLLQLDYQIDNKAVSIGDVLLTVVKVVTYETVGNNPDTNPQEKIEGEAMKEAMIAFLLEAGLTVNESWTDEELLAKYNEALVANQAGDNEAPSDDKVAGALEKVMSRLDSIESTISVNSNTELQGLIDIIVNSGKYKDFDDKDLKVLSIEKLRTLAANCKTSVGLPLIGNSGADTSEPVAYDMPE